MSVELIREAHSASYSLRDLLRQPELAATVDRLADALEQAEKERDEARRIAKNIAWRLRPKGFSHVWESCACEMCVAIRAAREERP